MADRNQLLNDGEEALRLAFDGRLSGLWTAMPCIVKSVNFTEMTVEAQPTIQGVVEDENGLVQNVNYPLLVDVPIVFPSAGGFTMTFPIAAGDEVLVVFASRAIDAWWQSGGIQRPVEARMHDLSDAFAIPGPRSVPRAIPAISTSAVQLRKDDGSSYIELSADGKIKLVASEVDFVGNLKVTGNIAATGTVTANSATVPVGLTTHVHTSATPGSPTGPATG